VVERGENFAVYRRVNSVTDAVGGVTVKTNQFTLPKNKREESSASAN